jgi:exodeoxyribonuclease V alpha subunit
MTRIDTITPQSRVLPDGFANHAQRWARESGASEALAKLAKQAAYAVSLATLDGHVCVHLNDIAMSLGEESNRAALRQRLLDSGIVGTPSARGVMPLILDDEDRLYLHRYFDYECRLAKSLVRRGPNADVHEVTPKVQARLNELFVHNQDALAAAPDWQKIAAAMALLSNLTIVSGGPGTGKTTTVVNLLACLLEQNPDCRIALAAPTGKAAARMTEAIRLRAGHLPVELQERLPTESFTIHRLLGVTPASGTFRHHSGNLLPIDALVVDEASMLDLAMATKLLEAVPDSARVILLGDKDQLAAVESGAVFAELSADPTLSDSRAADLARLCNVPEGGIKAPVVVSRPGLQDSAVWLTRNFRFASDSGIGRLAAEINSGDGKGAIARLRGDESNTLIWIEDGAVTAGEQSAQRIVAGYEHYRTVVRAGANDPAAITAAFGHFRILCAVRDGARGVDAINRMIERQFRKAVNHPLDPGERSEWYPGRPVMVLHNDYMLKLFNGDIGISLPDASGTLMVYFPDGDSGYRSIAPVRLPSHETAFAMTVHKSQGSEFDEVMVLLPAEHNAVLTRELVYTAVTRAREHVTMVSGVDVLTKTMQSVTLRHSGLLSRIGDLRSV